MDEPAAGLILAGGRSRRFGTDKAAYRIEGRSMLEHVYGAVSAVCPLVMLSYGAEASPPGDPPSTESARPSAAPMGRHSAFDPQSLPIVRDRFPDAGPLAGIHAGLLASPAEWLLVVACDMPFLTAEALGSLLQARGASAAADADADAVVAVDATGRLHPLCALYARRVAPVAEAQLRSGRYAVRDLLARLRTVRTVHLEEAALRNLNTPADVRPGPTSAE